MEGCALVVDSSNTKFEFPQKKREDGDYCEPDLDDITQSLDDAFIKTSITRTFCICKCSFGKVVMVFGVVDGDDGGREGQLLVDHLQVQED